MKIRIANCTLCLVSLLAVGTNSGAAFGQIQAQPASRSQNTKDAHSHAGHDHDHDHGKENHCFSIGPMENDAF